MVRHDSAPGNTPGGPAPSRYEPATFPREVLALSPEEARLIRARRGLHARLDDLVVEDVDQLGLPDEFRAEYDPELDGVFWAMEPASSIGEGGDPWSPRRAGQGGLQCIPPPSALDALTAHAREYPSDRMKLDLEWLVGGGRFALDVHVLPEPEAAWARLIDGKIGGGPLDKKAWAATGIGGGFVLAARLRRGEADDPSDLGAYGATAHYPEREATVRAFRAKLLDWLLPQVGRADVEMSNEGSMVARFAVESTGGRPVREGLQVVVRHDPDQ